MPRAAINARPGGARLMPKPAIDPKESRRTVNLTQLHAGDCGRLHAAELGHDDAAILMALGLARRSRFRVSKAGDPWILEVRSTRIGLADAVARGLQVIPEPGS